MNSQMMAQPLLSSRHHQFRLFKVFYELFAMLNYISFNCAHIDKFDFAINRFEFRYLWF